jgi:DNA-binding transcriptional LysR family regulator
MNTIDRLRLFVRIAERLSLSRAAEDLDIPQPTATRWLRSLESEYGRPLLRRTTRRITLTDAGLKMLAYAREVLAREVELRHALSGSDRGLRGKLTLGAPATLGTLVVLPIVTAFQSDNPELEIDLQMTERISDLVAENIDLTVRIGRVTDQQLVRLSVTTLTEAIACHPELAIGIDRNDPAHVERLPWLRLSGLRDGPAVHVRRNQTTVALAIEPRLWLDTGLSVREALLLRAGASLIHRYSIAPDLARGDLVELLPGWQTPTWPVSIVMPPGQRDPRVQALARYLRRSLRETLADRR